MGRGGGEEKQKAKTRTKERVKWGVENKKQRQKRKQILKYKNNVNFSAVLTVADAERFVDEAGVADVHQTRKFFGGRHAECKNIL